MDMWYFARICAHTRSWREFEKCRFAHYPSFFSIHVDTYVFLSIWFLVLVHLAGLIHGTNQNLQNRLPNHDVTLK